jgi:hypothetical protein
MLIWVVPLAVALSAVAWWQRLPEVIPTKWGPDGPTQFTPFVVVFALALVGCVALSIIATTGLLGATSYRRIWISTGVSAMLAGIWAFVATPSLGERGVEGPSGWALATPLLLAYGLLPAIVSTVRRPTPTLGSSEPSAD